MSLRFNTLHFLAIPTPFSGRFVLIFKDSSEDLFRHFVKHITTIVDIYHHVKNVLIVAVFADTTCFGSVYVGELVDVFCYFIKVKRCNIIYFAHFKHIVIVFRCACRVPIVFDTHCSYFLSVDSFNLFYCYSVFTCLSF